MKAGVSEYAVLTWNVGGAATEDEWLQRSEETMKPRAFRSSRHGTDLVIV